MAENPMPVDEMDDYIFGRLTPAAGRRFEMRLARDATLRQHLRELEEGALALAMAAPQRQPPREVWTKIQAGVARERQTGFRWPVLPLHWLLRGWPLAGGLMLAVFIHLAAIHLRMSGQFAPPASRGGKQTEITVTSDALPKDGRFAGHENTNAATPVATAKDAPTGALASVQGGTFTPADEHARRESDTTISRETMASNAGSQPARLRQALSATTSLTNTPAAQAHAPDFAHAAPVVPLTNSPQAQVQVDYVELSNPLAVVVSASGSLVLGNGAGWTIVDPTIPVRGPSEAVSIFASGNDLVVTINPAMLPANIGPLTIWVADVDGNQTVVGTVNPAVNLMVITIENADLYLGYLYTVTAGGTNILGGFP